MQLVKVHNEQVIDGCVHAHGKSKPTWALIPLLRTQARKTPWYPEPQCGTTSPPLSLPREDPNQVATGLYDNSQGAV